jgi:glycosyltransferase involved in cell wall biosynthesis
MSINEAAMAHILIVANSSWNLQHFRGSLIRELVRNGHQVTTVSPQADGIASEEVSVPHRICRMDRSGRNPLHEIAFIRRFRRIIIEERPNILLGFTIKPNIYGCSLCRLLGIPAVPNVTGLGTAFLGGSVFRRAVVTMYRFAFARAGMVFFQNPDDEALFLREGIVRPGQSRVLPGSGIDLAHFRPTELPANPRFLMIARLLGDKGVREYVEAARMMRTRLPSASFALLGELDHDNRSAIPEEELEAWVREGAVEYLGSAADVRPYIAESVAVVLPSYREGLPRTLLEAAAMGRPLIGTDVPGCRELVRDGLTGFLCEARNAASLAAAVERIARMPHEERTRLGAEARLMAEREFDERLVAGAYLEVVRSLSG